MKPSSLRNKNNKVQKQKDMNKVTLTKGTQDEGSPNTINNNLFCEVTTELPIGSELANTFENQFIYEQIPQN